MPVDPTRCSRCGGLFEHHEIDAHIAVCRQEFQTSYDPYGTEGTCSDTQMRQAGVVIVTDIESEKRKAIVCCCTLS